MTIFRLVAATLTLVNSGPDPNIYSKFVWNIFFHLLNYFILSCFLVNTQKKLYGKNTPKNGEKKGMLIA